jgi:DNA-directed RNA polymerase specialized sigma24 family protein
VLAVIYRRQAELLLLRSHGLSYDELAAALDLIWRTIAK